MEALAALFAPNRRVAPAGFLLDLALVLFGGVACATLLVGEGVGAPALAGWLAASWSWLAVHANRRHDSGQSGRWLVLAWPLAMLGTLLIGAVLALLRHGPALIANGTIRTDAGFDETVEALRRLSELYGVELETAIASALLLPASVPLAASLIVSVLVGFGRRDPEANRWGSPP